MWWWLIASIASPLLVLSDTATVDSSLGLDNTVDGSDELIPYEPKDIMSQLFQQTGGLGWTNKQYWDSDDVCSYYGVTCFQDSDANNSSSSSSDRWGHVRSLALPANGLRGTTPAQLWQLPYLESVRLDQNPDLVVDITNIGDAQHLDELVLNVDAVTSWKPLPNVSNTLRLLTLAPPTSSTGGGSAGSPLPSQLFKLTRLEALWADDCQFSGDLSNPAIGNWFDMKQLNLNRNRLKGNLPTQLGQLVNLESLNLGGNQFTGPIPINELNQLVELQVLDISRDPKDKKTSGNLGLIGSVPSLHKMPHLAQVDLSYQSLSGSLPNNFLLQAPATLPLTVDLRGNQLTGDSLPSVLVVQENMDLYLADNLFTSLPSKFCQNDAPQDWLSGDVGKFQNCDGLLCPVGTFHPNQGRQTSADAPCQECPSAKYMGQTTCATTADGNINEYIVLQEFLGSTNGFHWKQTDGWLSDSKNQFGQGELNFNFCTWHGITCESGHVVEIRLPNNGLTGAVPPVLYTLPQLRVLDLSRNGLAFSVEGLSQATQLQVLNLAQTDIVADSVTTDDMVSSKNLAVKALLSQLSQSKSIQVLSLASNQLSDTTLPEELYNLTSIQELDFSNNDYGGSLSANIAQLTQLRKLSLQGNQITGTIPTQMGQLAALQELQLSENKMNGNIPSELNSCSGLAQLSLRNNAFGGSLPDWTALSQLTELDLTGNALEGALPDSFLQSVSDSNSTRREFLFGNNKLSGGIPTSWNSRFPNLFLDLTGNQITGALSECTSQQQQWMDGLVADYGCNAILCPIGTYNELGRQTGADNDCRTCTGASVMGTTTCDAGATNSTDAELAALTRKARDLEILTEFYHATLGENWVRQDGWTVTADYCAWYGISCDAANDFAVQSIELPDNGLTGTPPASMWELVDLADVDLSGNALEFSFEGIEKAQNLISLDLASTQLDSLEGLQNVSDGLLYLFLDDNDLAGAFPSPILSMTKTLRKLSLNNNQLTGFLPGKELSDFIFLKELFLFDNWFEGQLPGSLGQLTSVTYLGLSGNQWTGTIPSLFGQLHALEALAIQGNPETGSGRGLSGPLPAFGSLPKIKQLYLAHHSLTGPIPDNFLGGITDLNSPLTIDLTGNRLTGRLPPSLARFETVDLYVAGNQLTEPIPSAICRQSGWMKSQVARFSCKAILCPPDTYQTGEGRQSGESGSASCQACASGETTKYYGSMSCLTVQEQQERDEREVLEDLYASTSGDQWVDREGWMQPDVSICSWHGIVCQSSSVVSIQLVHNGLQGNVPSSVFSSLPNLMELDLSWNQGLDLVFDGQAMAQAQSLNFLNLDHTGLTSIAGLENAPNLAMLRLMGNNFGSNAFPTEVLQISALEVLYLSNNDVGTALPTTGWSTNFVGFECEACNLQGPFPTFLGTLTGLEFLDLSDNDLTGTVPSSVGNLTKLKVLDLSNQATSDSPGLSGSLPSFALAPDLREVFLQNNNFSSIIPTDFLASVLNGTVTVDVRYNALTGVIPGELARITTAKFYAAANQLTGVSTELCSLAWNDNPAGSSDCDYVLCGAGEYNGFGRAASSSPCETCSGDASNSTVMGRTYCLPGEREILKEVYAALGGKQWKNQDGWDSDRGSDEDDVCTWYGVTCHDGTLRPGTVKELALSDNYLQGTLPDRIWKLTELMVLDLSDNDIFIDSLSNLGDALSLTELKLSSNTVGSISGIGGAAALQAFHCTDCKIQGPFPDEMFNLVVLEYLYLNYNEITGELSTDIARWSQLKELHLQHNQFNGTIPEELGSLNLIEVIDLGQNEFSGRLPANISSLANLRVLAIDNERPQWVGDFGVGPSGITGNLPPFNNNPKLRELYLSNNNIEGTIPADFLNGVVDKSATLVVNLESNFIQQEVPGSLAQFDDLRIYLGNNQIVGVAPEVCAKTNWMDGLMATGCDAFLCPAGFYSEFGRRTTSTSCQLCDHETRTTFVYGSMWCVAYSSSRDDRDMLEELYDLALGDTWINNKNWKNPDEPICKWFGVTCDNSTDQERVAELSLPSNNLRGKWGSIVFYLPRLRKLDVSGNRVALTFRDMGDAVNLESVNVKSTFVVDLEGLGKAKQLKELRLSDNTFFGKTLPEDIYELSGLTVLELANAGFSGTLSASGLGQLSNLVVFNASHNEFEGNIPDVFEKFNALEIFDLAGNLFYGTLPASLQSAQSLQFLNARGPNDPSAPGMSGPLVAFANSSSLIYLDLGSNSFTGTIPSNLLAGVSNPTTTSVTVLLDSNILHGSIPEDLVTRFENLTIDLADNEIESIPQGLCNNSDFGCDGFLCPTGKFNEAGRQTSSENICRDCPGDTRGALGQTNCPALEKVRNKDILKQFFTSTGGSNWKNKDGWLTNPDICTWYGVTCRDNAFVETINLGGNNLVNSPPKEIFELGGLKKLWLYSNPIDFRFDGIENATMLENIQLDSTNTQSLQGVGNAPALKYLDVRFNGLLGTLPEDEIDQLDQLEVLLVSDNKFFGQLPQFSNNRKLTTLRASGNAFVGALPVFDVHPLIKTIDVSHNQLFGTIPEGFLEAADSSTSMFLDLSHNKLKGVLPPIFTRFPDLTIFVQGNQFTGIDPKLCEMSGWNSGGVGLFSCDGILCPPERFAPQGRATSENQCEPCPNANDAPFFGHTTCEGVVAGIQSSAATRTGPWILGSLLFTVSACWFLC
ncbi:hypothetical protein ACA910_019060 [Epithemia clementina (nom. ined.)]